MVENSLSSNFLRTVQGEKVAPQGLFLVSVKGGTDLTATARGWQHVCPEEATFLYTHTCLSVGEWSRGAECEPGTAEQSKSCTRTLDQCRVMEAAW